VPENVPVAAHNRPKPSQREDKNPPVNLRSTGGLGCAFSFVRAVLSQLSYPPVSREIDELPDIDELPITILQRLTHDAAGP
jgi:hypothetical protein